jgi:hypothetical protein
MTSALRRGAPAPETVFDRVTGPYRRRCAAGLPGARACGEDA